MKKRKIVQISYEVEMPDFDGVMRLTPEQLKQFNAEEVFSQEAVVYCSNPYQLIEVADRVLDYCAHTDELTRFRIDTLLWGQLEELAGLNQYVPAKYQEKVKSHAYEKGHWAGTSEIFAELRDLIENVFKGQ